MVAQDGCRFWLSFGELLSLPTNMHVATFGLRDQQHCDPGHIILKTSSSNPGPLDSESAFNWDAKQAPGNTVTKQGNVGLIVPPGEVQSLLTSMSSSKDRIQGYHKL